ncbi:MAG: hypothetical protein CSA52_03445 [Gammaproteobacteria bacterium]|nr:MAG: hypothetical protein CSB48_04175 [Pseudomonadota bacterium]PIE38248.1 MAG: hypothetical protein CSA52_03445 [Gammaproteobacteria bacterium]
MSQPNEPKRNSLLKDMMTLTKGVVLAQIFAIGLGPILTRLYKPDEFGTLALFASLVSFCSIIATGRYEMALVLPKKDHAAVNLLAVLGIIALSVCTTIFFVAVIFSDSIALLLGNTALKDSLILLPISVLIASLIQGFYFWHCREKSFDQMAQSKAILTSCSETSKLILGYFGFNESGLIWGMITGQATALLLLVRGAKEKLDQLQESVSALEMRVQAKVYSGFPKYDLISALSFVAYSNFVVFYANKMLAAGAAGLYFMADRLLRIPVMVFVTPFSEVFYQHLSKNTGFDTLPLELNKYFGQIYKFVLIPFFGCVFVSQYLVEIIFGSDWSELYIYLFIFSLPVAARILTAPYSHVLKTIGKQHISTLLHLSKLALLFCLILFSSHFSISTYQFLQLFAVFDASIIILFATTIDYLIKNPLIYRRLFSSFSITLMHTVFIYFSVISPEQLT